MPQLKIVVTLFYICEILTFGQVMIPPLFLSVNIFFFFFFFFFFLIYFGVLTCYKPRARRFPPTWNT